MISVIMSDPQPKLISLKLTNLLFNLPKSSINARPDPQRSVRAVIWDEALFPLLPVLLMMINQPLSVKMSLLLYYNSKLKPFHHFIKNYKGGWYITHDLTKKQASAILLFIRSYGFLLSKFSKKYLCLRVFNTDQKIDSVKKSFFIQQLVIENTKNRAPSIII